MDCKKLLEGDPTGVIIIAAILFIIAFVVLLTMNGSTGAYAN